MWQSLDPVATALFGLGCTAAGATITALILRAWRRAGTTSEPVRIDPRLDADLAARARLWADQHGAPELSGFAHHRLRVATALQQRTRGRYFR